MENQTQFVLTLDIVKKCIAYPSETLIFKTLNNLCDVWYKIAQKEGATDEEAAQYALDKLGEAMLRMGEQEEK